LGKLQFSQRQGSWSFLNSMTKLELGNEENSITKLELGNEGS
jgi:hypothetical protein